MRKLEDKRASIQPIKSKLKIKILEEGEIKSIVDTALKILEEVGIFFPLKEALQRLFKFTRKQEQRWILKNRLLKFPVM